MTEKDKPAWYERGWIYPVGMGAYFLLIGFVLYIMGEPWSMGAVFLAISGIWILLMLWHHNTGFSAYAVNMLTEDEEKEMAYENMADCLGIETEASRILVRNALAKEKGLTREKWKNYEPTLWDLREENLSHIKELIDKERVVPYIRCIYRGSQKSWLCPCGTVNRDDDTECMSCGKTRNYKEIRENEHI